MAYRVSNGAGTSFNTAANWDEGVNTPSIHATTNITITSGGVLSANFTAPNTTNACTGVIVPITQIGSAGNIVATLQENAGGGFSDTTATATIAITSLVASTHVFFEFGTPYVFTTTTANRYRIKLNTSGASGVTSAAADSGGSNFSYLAFMNNNVVPTTGDDVFIISPNQGAAHIIDLDSSPSFGSGTSTSVPSFRSWGNGLVLSNNGGLSYPTGTSRTITLKGNVCVENGGKLRMGTAASKIAAGITARLAFDQNGTTTNYGFQHLSGGETTLQGADLTFKKTTLSSGVGTAASPAITADSVDWTVGDELLFVPTTDSATNYNESEIRFIITKNSATSYVLSDTSGGSEAALTFTHTDGVILNLTRRVLINTTNTSHAWYADFAETVAASSVNIDGARLETFGGATANKTTIIFSNASTEKCELDDIVFYRNLGVNVTLNTNTETRSFSWLIFYDAAAASLTIGSLKNKTLTNFYSVKSQNSGFSLSATSNCTFVSCGAWASGIGGTGNGFLATNSTKCTFNTCESHANRLSGTSMSSGVEIRFVNCSIGTDGTNGTADINLTTDTYNKVVYDNCLFGSSTLINNYAATSDGSEIAINKYNQTTNDHRWYTAHGMARSTGAGLADTTIKTSASLGIRIAPENTSPGFYWDYKILARPSSAVSALGFIRKNGTYGTDDVIVELYLPGLIPGTDTPSDTVTMPSDVSWNVFNLAAVYSGTAPLYATVRIIGKTTTSGAFFYIDDLYNGTNLITSIDTWNDGKPSDIQFEQLGDSAAVWAVSTSVLTTAGTVGYKLTNMEDSIWDEVFTGHTTSDTFGNIVQNMLTTGRYLALR